MRFSPVRSACRFAAAAAALLIAVAAEPAFPQDQPAPKDTIFARKILMGAIDRNMDILETMTTSGNLDLAEGREHADLISIMLMAFPHMFPPVTNQWKANVSRNPGTDTYASPDLWTNYADFYQRAANASKIAFEASHAKEAEEFKAHVSQLRRACDSCHAAYQKTD